MAIEYMGLNNIQGPLAVIEGVDDTFYEEMVTVTLDNGEKRIGADAFAAFKRNAWQNA